MAKTNTLKHGHAYRSKKSGEYNSWRGMKERCNNVNHIGYPRYGGKGVKVYDKWVEFEEFLKDMGLKPTSSHSLDRYPNPDGNYEPGNCRWATSTEQRINQRTQDNSNRVLKSWKNGNRSRVSKLRIDITGQKFHRLSVINCAGKIKDRIHWNCLCDCGNEAIVSGKSIRKGLTKSCGCLNKEIARKNAIIRNTRKKVT